jgi:hypothetical protein
MSEKFLKVFLPGYPMIYLKMFSRYFNMNSVSNTYQVAFFELRKSVQNSDKFFVLLGW